MSEKSPILMWFRRDLRLGDHEALSAACKSGSPVIPVFLHDELTHEHGAAPLMRLGQSVDTLQKMLERRGSRLILRNGRALETLLDLVKETGASAVYWSRMYDPVSRKRDEAVKSALKEAQIEAKSFAGQVLFEPWTVETGTGGFYRVYSPMWKNVKDRSVPNAIAAPEGILGPETWPESETLESWNLAAAMRRGADVVAAWQCVGEEAALERLERFIEEKVDAYKERRDFPSEDSTSQLSENLAYGEISPRVIWHAGWRAHHEGAKGAEHFVKELVWREFSYHLAYHTPEIVDKNWRPEWDSFPWNEDEENPQVIAWKQGRTGEPFVDAAMREMFVTGKMHNRARMIVASYLCKHLMCHWKIGLRWFEECLTDWDPAANAMGWQWTAGSGPDAAPYFRIFNPETQLEKFDPKGVYRRCWIAEGEAKPTETALSYFDAVPLSWRLDPKAKYPKRIVSLSEGRDRALAAYEAR